MRNFLTKDVGWKLFSLAVAAVIWFTIHALSRDAITPARPLESWATRTFTDVSVLVVSAAADVREFKVHPAAVQVTVSGRPEVMTALEEKEIRVTVDLTGIEAARDLKKRVDAAVPPGVTVVRVAPAELDVVVPPKRENGNEQTQ
jgi:YbbR domain-containing protein